MDSVDHSSTMAVPESLVSSQVAMARLAVGLLQGIVLYFLYRASQQHTWPATDPLVFVPLLLTSVLGPVILMSSLGHMSRNQAAVWTAVSLLIIAALGVYDVWRTGFASLSAKPAITAPLQGPSAGLSLVLPVAFFIAQSLVLAGVRERRRIASYASYFETAWKLMVQLAFSAFFVGAVWIVLWLGASLFKLVQLGFFERLLKESWFVIPVIAFAFSCAMHITDVRPAMVRGIRTLLLVLMSWILPVTTLIVGGFLSSLPFTGLAPLWATRHATSVLLFAAATFVILINAAYQDGATGTAVARLIRASARAAAVMLVPITAIAILALGLRVADYGWTTDRIIAASCLLVAACYTIGYARAALRPGWLAAVAKVNVATAVVVLGVLFALFSPLADPARLSVIDQVSRLTSGKVAAEKFDFFYLYEQGARYGRQALKELAATAHGKDSAIVRERVALALSGKGRMVLGRPDQEKVPVTIVANLAVWPSGAHLPDSFVHADWKGVPHGLAYPACLFEPGKLCDVFLVDLTGDGKAEIVVVSKGADVGAGVLAENAQGQWRALGQLPIFFSRCESMRQALIAGRYRAVAPLINDIDIGGTRVNLRPPERDDAFQCPNQ